MISKFEPKSVEKNNKFWGWGKNHLALHEKSVSDNTDVLFKSEVALFISSQSSYQPMSNDPAVRFWTSLSVSTFEDCGAV